MSGRTKALMMLYVVSAVSFLLSGALLLAILLLPALKEPFGPFLAPALVVSFMGIVIFKFAAASSLRAEKVNG